MNLILRISLMIMSLLSSNIFAQNYSSPLDIKLLLSGSFGELRGNHFHSGIDIKTDGVEGQKVYAIADGYVSRIKVSSWGYGKAIYINHYDGKTSVYAHLQKFSKRIEEIVKREHYNKESFEIDFHLRRHEIKINKGDIIALTGNSGSSGGAHLHFEIRDTKKEKPINPIQFGFDITDNIAPSLEKLKLYSISGGRINNKEQDQVFNIQKLNKDYSINKPLKVNGSFAVGISTYDKLNGAYNKNGVYSIRLYVDSVNIYEFKVDELSFKTTRYINAHIDYKEKKINKRKYHQCYKLPHNNLNNYTNLINNGIINFDDNERHLIHIEVTDFFQNTSTLSFYVQSINNEPYYLENDDDEKTEKFLYSQSNIFKANKFEIHMQSNSLYESLNFEYNTLDSVNGVFGKIHQCHYDDTPVHKKYAISIKTNVPDHLKKKVYIAKKNEKDDYIYMGGNWQNNFIKTKVREFGDFCVIADTINPEIKGVNIYPGKILNTQTTIKLSIKDKHSGIKSYRGEIDGKWILMEYDYKRNLLRYDIEEYISKGKHTFTLKVIDNVGNYTEYEADFTY